MESNESEVKKHPNAISLEITSSDRQLVLKQYTPEDADEAFALIDRNRGHLSQFDDETATKYPTLDSFRESIVSPKNPKRLRFAIRNKDGVLVGSINITPDENNLQRGEVGYYLGDEFQKKGYTKQAVELLTDYAFGHLGYQSLYGEVTEGNDVSIKVLERAGYQETKRQDGKIILSKEKPRAKLELHEFEVEKVIRETDNYRVVMDWKPSLENQPEGRRFFIEPKTDSAQKMLLSAAKAHNIGNFNERQVPFEEGSAKRQCLRADFIAGNLPSLLKGKVEIPKEGEDTIPSLDRMEKCLKNRSSTYTLSD